MVDFKGEGQGEIKLQITPSKPFPKKWPLHGKKLVFKKGVNPPIAIGGPQLPGKPASWVPRKIPHTHQRVSPRDARCHA